MKKEQIIKYFEKYTEGKDFKLNPDKKFLEPIWKSLEESSEKTNMMWCPCRPRTGNIKEDVKRDLMCACHFKNQITWKNKGECWCALFVKR